MEHRMRAVADGGFGRWVPDRAARPKRLFWSASPAGVRRARGLLVWLACVLLIQTIAFVRHHGPATADRSTAMCLRR
jgi:hypothetical protein